MKTTGTERTTLIIRQQVNGQCLKCWKQEKMGIMIIETLMMAILENHSSAKRAGLVEGTLYVVVTSFRKL